MATFVLIFTVLLSIITAITPPSDFSTDCRYVTAATYSGTYNNISTTFAYPIDACWSEHIISTTGYKWECIDGDTNVQLSRFSDDSCSSGGTIDIQQTVQSFNCSSTTACPYSRFYSTPVYENCTLNETIYDPSVVAAKPDGTEKIERVFALNICHDKVVFTCNDSVVYAWMYDDNECQVPSTSMSYGILEQTEYRCTGGAAIKSLVATCNMEGVSDPFVDPVTTASPTYSPVTPGDPTRAPQQMSMDTSTTESGMEVPVTTEVDAACMLSIIVNLVVLITVTMVFIQ